MSHVARVQSKILDLNSLTAAAARVGLTFVENQTTYRTYYGGQSAEGRSAHALRLADATAHDYEIGVLPAKDGQGYELVFDSWGPGRRLEAAAGAGLTRLVDEYGYEVASRRLRRQGWRVQRATNAQGQLQLRATR